MTIDWNKPLRTVENHRPAGFMTNCTMGDGHDFRSVCWRSNYNHPYVVQVDDEGHAVRRVIMVSGRIIEIGARLVENVPEEPKDHLLLYRRGRDWLVDGAGLMSHQRAAETIRKHPNFYDMGVAVRVPV